MRRERSFTFNKRDARKSLTDDQIWILEDLYATFVIPEKGTPYLAVVSENILRGDPNLRGPTLDQLIAPEIQDAEWLDAEPAARLADALEAAAKKIRKALKKSAAA